MSQKTAIDSLLEVAELQENDMNLRILSITNNQTKKTAKIHLKGTVPYWASVEDVYPQIERRVVVAGFMAYKERYANLIQRHPDIRNSLELPIKLTEEFLVDGRIVGKILQEAFINTADRIFNWKDVSYELTKETIFNPTVSDFYFTRTQLPPGKLVEAVTTRHEALAKAIEKFPMVGIHNFFKEIKIEQAISNLSAIDTINRDQTAIIKSISDLDPIETTMYKTGMPPVNFVRNLLALYEKNLVILTYKGNNVKDMLQNPGEYGITIKNTTNTRGAAGFNEGRKINTPSMPSRPATRNS